jgi:hypothetical protein
MPTSAMHWLLISLVWLAAAFACGAGLAWLYRRLYTGLSFYKLWAFWTTVLSLVAAAVFALDFV